LRLKRVLKMPLKVAVQNVLSMKYDDIDGEYGKNI
jgi:hypothetical protein